MKIVRYVKQSNLKDCASSCIYNIIRFYKGSVNYNSITKHLHITEKGSSIYNVVKTLRYYKFKSDAYECNYNSLVKIGRPVIAYLKINDYYHYVIVKRIKNDNVYIFDPVRGDIKYTKSKFILEYQSVIIDVICDNDIPKEKSSYKRYLYTLIKGSKYILLITFIIAILFTISNLFSTYLFKYIIDKLNFNKIIIYIIFFELFRNILSFIYGKLMIIGSIKLNKNIRENMYEKIFNLPNTKEAKTFNIIYRIDDLICISDFIFNFPELLIDLLYVFIIYCYFLYIGLVYPIILIILLIVVILFHFLVRKKLINLFDKERNNHSLLTNNLIEKINLLPIIHKLKLSQEFIKKENDNYKEYLSDHKKLNNNMLYYNLVLNIIYLIFNIIVILISFHYSSIKLISLGDFYINYILLQMYTSSINNILNFDRLFLSSKNAFKRIVDLYDYNFDGEEDNKNINTIYESTFIYDKYNKFKDNMINLKDGIYVYNNEGLLSESIDNNIRFNRDISNHVLSKIKHDLLISNDLASNKEKIALARSLLSNNNLVLVNIFNNIDPVSERTILKRIMTEYNIIIVLVSSRKDNSDLFKRLVKVKGGKCEKVRCL